MLGILKAGAAFVPLDPTAPVDWVAFIADEAHLAAMVSTATLVEPLASERPWTAPTILIDAEAIARESALALECRASAEDLAFINYDAAAGGRPKGVMAPHRAVARLVGDGFLSLGPRDVVLHWAPLASNAAMFEIWAPLLKGAALAVVASSRGDIDVIGDAIRRYGVTAAWLSAAALHAMVDRGGEALRPLRQLIVAGGGPLSPGDACRALELSPDCRLLSCYGPSESLGLACGLELSRDAAADAPVPLGRPIAQAKVHVLDEALRPVASGGIGELFVAGEGVALGYLHQPELTADRFLPDRFGGDLSGRMYRTGDLVRQRADGVLEFVRRSDRETEVGRERTERFWKEKLRRLDEPTMLASAPRGAVAAGGPNSGGQTRLLGRLQARLGVAETDRLLSFARSQRASLNILAQGAWALLLRSYCGQGTVAFGVGQVGGVGLLEGAEKPADPQSFDDWRRLVDQSLPVIQTLRLDQVVGPWLRALRDDILIAQDYADAGLGDIQRWAGRAGQDLFDTVLIFADRAADALQPTDEGSIADFPALALVVRAGGEIEFDYSYRRDRFDAEQVAAIHGRFVHLIDQIAADSSRALGELKLLTEDERTEILNIWSRGESRAVEPVSLHELFQAQVKALPDAVAVIYEGSSLTYGALNARANQLARRLRLLGVGPDVLVGLAVERSLDMAVGLLGILKAGGAYVPLDPAYPKERLAYMIENAGLALVLTQNRLLSNLPATKARFWRLDGDWAEAELQSTTDLETVSSPQNLAYCIYTSGSTGRPKGVGLEQAALVNLLQWQQAALPAVARTLQFASFSFDVSFQEFFSAWIAGGALIMPSEDSRRDFRRLLSLLRTEAVERLYLPTAVLQPLAAVKQATDVRLPDLRQIITAGEQLRLTPDLSAWLGAEPQCALINQYGPTESHVVSNFVATGYAEGALPPIGRPIWNTQLYILDAELNPAPVGIVGELYIGGAGLARGYVGRPELTAERFIPSPFARAAGERLYRTGDMARWRADGDIEYVGRVDHQVKIRGFRIELGEIEARLLAHGGVREAAVVAREGISGKQLIGYVAPASGALDSGPTQDGRAPEAQFVERLKQHLGSSLPDYMVPAKLIILDRMPLTPSGKIDRNALPAPQVSSEAGSRPEPPASDVEKKLAAIWRRLLKLPYVGLDENFFDLGGASLDLIALHEEIRAQFDDIPMTELFEQMTIRTLAARLQTRGADKLTMTDLHDRKQRQNEALRRIWRRRTISAP